MATYADKSFDTNHYNNVRPQYPKEYYQTLINYHKGSRELGIDVGCGSGFVARELTNYFTQVIGTDISAAMIDQCNKNLSQTNISFKVCPGEDLAFDNEFADMICSAEALHWVDTTKFFKEAFRVLKKNGTLSYWMYKEPVWVDYPQANELYEIFTYGPNHLGPYWEQPGKNRLRDMLRHDDPSKFGFTDVIRREYDPDPKVTDRQFKSPTTLHISKTIKLPAMKEYLTSWSAYHSWKTDAKNRDKEDIVDQFIKDLEGIIGDKEFTVTWATVYTLARK